MTMSNRDLVFLMCVQTRAIVLDVRRKEDIAATVVAKASRMTTRIAMNKEAEKRELNGSCDVEATLAHELVDYHYNGGSDWKADWVPTA